VDANLACGPISRLSLLLILQGLSQSILDLLTIIASLVDHLCPIIEGVCKALTDDPLTSVDVETFQTFSPVLLYIWFARVLNVLKEVFNGVDDTLNETAVQMLCWTIVHKPLCTCSSFAWCLLLHLGACMFRTAALLIQYLRFVNFPKQCFRSGIVHEDRLSS
jgi:hypothetical protein